MVANLAGLIASLVLGIWWLSELRCERLLSQAAEQGVDSACVVTAPFKSGLILFPTCMVLGAMAGYIGSRWWYLFGIAFADSTLRSSEGYDRFVTSLHISASSAPRR
jgi:hypothetical protein